MMKRGTFEVRSREPPGPRTWNPLTSDRGTELMSRGESAIRVMRYTFQKKIATGPPAVRKLVVACVLTVSLSGYSLTDRTNGPNSFRKFGGLLLRTSPRGRWRMLHSTTTPQR
jgi:hypothetical protein